MLENNSAIGDGVEGCPFCGASGKPDPVNEHWFAIRHDESCWFTQNEKDITAHHAIRHENWNTRYSQRSEGWQHRTVSLEGRLELGKLRDTCDVGHEFIVGLALRENGAANVANVERDLFQLNGKEVRVIIEWRDVQRSGVVNSELKSEND